MDITDTYDATNIAINGARNPFKGDEHLAVQFRMEAVKDEAKSREANRPVFKEVPFIRIQVPGDRDNIIDAQVSDDPSVTQNPGHQMNYRLRFKRQWDAFSAAQSQEAVSGTPLAKWPGVTRADVAELAFDGIKTVEQLAAMSDGNTQRAAGRQALKQRALDWLAQAKDAGHSDKLRHELSQRDAQIAALQEQMRDLAARLDKKGK